jgi:hypothetical protein
VPRTPYLHPHEVMQHLETGSYRVLLKRPENYDLRFRELIDQLFAQVADSLGEFGDDRIVRREAGIFISSGATTTPFHFDPEIGFFFQIEREKIYHARSNPKRCAACFRSAGGSPRSSIGPGRNTK